MKLQITVDMDAIEALCRKWHIAEFAFFGSVVRDDFRPDSDIDVLATFAPDAHWSLFDHVTMQDELAELFGRKVDFISRRGIENSRNYLRRKAILDSAEVIYAAA